MLRRKSGDRPGAPFRFEALSALMRAPKAPWARMLLLGAGASFFMVLGFLAAQPGLAERVRHYAEAVFESSVDWLDRTVRGEQAARAQAATWERLPSELQDLEINVIAMRPRPTRASAMTQLDGGLLLVATAHGDFSTLDAATGVVADGRIASPLNLDAFKADPLWDTPGLDRRYFRVNDVLALPARDQAGEGVYDLYATHHWFTPACIQWRFSKTRIRVAGSQVTQDGAWKTLFQAEPCFQVMTEVSAFYLPYSGNLSGGRMIDYDAEHLLVSTGDLQAFEARGVDVAQDPHATLGKFLLVDKVTGGVTPFASGTRNAQGLLRDSRGRIWATEHGPHGGDELNLVTEGANLGWPLVTYGVNYDQRPWPGAAREGAHDRFVHPAYAWLPSVGISNLVEAPADAFPNWRGDLLVGSLVGSTLFRVRLEGDDVTYAEPIRFPGRSIRDIEVMPDGRIAILDNRMAMIFIRNGAGFGRSKRYDAESLVAPKIAAGGLPKARATSVALGEAIYARRCAECHSLTGASAAGPQLRDVAGRRIGAEHGFTYSEALAEANGAWSETTLSRYILAPESFGAVSMPNPGLDKKTAAAVAAYLVELRRQDRRRVVRSGGEHASNAR